MAQQRDTVECRFTLTAEAHRLLVDLVKLLGSVDASVLGGSRGGGPRLTQGDVVSRGLVALRREIEVWGLGGMPADVRVPAPTSVG